MTFQKTVIRVATILLIIALLTIGYLLYRAKLNSVYPPEISQCPDYWKVIGVAKCENVQNLGNGTCGKVQDFSGREWQGPSGLKRKYEWSKSCDVVWDGITNNPSLR